MAKKNPPAKSKHMPVQNRKQLEDNQRDLIDARAGDRGKIAKDAAYRLAKTARKEKVKEKVTGESSELLRSKNLGDKNKLPAAAYQKRLDNYYTTSELERKQEEMRKRGGRHDARDYRRSKRYGRKPPPDLWPSESPSKKKKD